MNKLDQFVLLVQTWVLTERRHAVSHVKLVADAMKVPSVAVPDDLEKAAIEWCNWRAELKGEKPAWLVEHEENVTNKITFEQLDGDPVWWRHAEDVIPTEAPQSWHAFVSGRGRFVEMTKRDATAFLEWARELPGWSDDDPPLRQVNDDG